ncbi:MAG: hypothetical protein E6Q73_04625 [Pseudorhodobacter sp.]|nr:MAG: hypothetical protein E6Q73_04625 [Pseudorhodobacter sp.]
MARLRFYMARASGDEARLQGWSVPEPDVLRALAGRRVAVVGNARSLAAGDFGAAIDAHDLVIRVNAAPLPSARSHGLRTDWIGLSIPVAAEVLAERSPDLTLWMTPKRKRLPLALFRRGRVFVNPVARNAALAAELGARPTTGLMLIDLCLRAGAETDLYGFDFFETKSLSGQRSAAQVPHDFAAERAWVMARLGPGLRLNGAGQGAGQDA